MEIQNSPLVTIICTTYNHELYIGQCIEGFLIQKTNFHFEVIVHDDASTDRTVEIVKSYELKHPSLFQNIYQKENQFSKKEINIWTDIMFPKAKGRYIALCEGDDYWTDPLKLQKQVDLLEKFSKYSACIHSSIEINIENEFSLDSNKSICRNVEKYEYTINDIIVIGRAAETSSIVFRSEKLKSNQEFVAKLINERLMGDLGLFLILATESTIISINESMSVYRKSFVSITRNLDFRNNFIQEYIDILRSYNELTDFRNDFAIKMRILKLYKEIVKFSSKRSKRLYYLVMFLISSIKYLIFDVKRLLVKYIFQL